MNVLVSVIMAVYNGEKYILESIQSVMQQDYKNIEMIIVNDGSTDATASLIDQHYPSVKYIAQNNQGQSAALNSGINESRGEYIAFLDADDIYLADKIASQVNILQAMPKVDMVFGQVEEFVSSEMTGKIKQDLRKQEQATHLAGSGLFRRKCFEYAGLFDTQWEIGGFIDWYMRAREADLKDYLIEKINLRRRLHGNNMGCYLSHKKHVYLKIVKAALDRRKNHEK